MFSNLYLIKNRIFVKNHDFSCIYQFFVVILRRKTQNIYNYAISYSY